MHYLTPPPGLRQEKLEPAPFAGFQPSTFLPGVHALEVLTRTVDAHNLASQIRINSVYSRASRQSGRRTAEPVYESGSAHLVSNDKSHPPTTLPLWSYAPGEPAWSYQVYSKDVYVCRAFPATPPTENAPGSRTAIFEFSDKSRNHLNHICCNSGHLVKSQFCLTYHDQNPVDGNEVKKHLDRWLKSYRRRFPDSSYLWVLEFQKRGVPHYHLFLSTPVDRAMQKKMARSWVKITNGTKAQYGWHCRRANWIPWNMENGNYLMKQYAIKLAQKEVPPQYQNVGRFWGASRSMNPVAAIVEPSTLAKWTEKAVIPWEPSAVRHYFDKILRRYQEKLMNYDRKGNRRTDQDGKVKKKRKASMIRHESELSGCFKIRNGSKIFIQLMNYVTEYGPDHYTLKHAIKGRIPF